jgi:VanZ family protein
LSTPLRFPILWLIVGASMLLTVIALSLASIQHPIEFNYADKLNHLLAYAALMYWWGMLQFGKRRIWLLILPLMGLALEGLQTVAPHRHADWFDALANVSGVLLGWLLLRTPARELLASIDRFLADRLDPG